MPNTMHGEHAKIIYIGESEVIHIKEAKIKMMKKIEHYKQLMH